ncbi:hypothetical protein FANTH_1553 [Fusarium anthophilum]|uniref:Peptidase S8/S53 domain-containing protein n=1 Tax=Fusarium anthophilum TaxID=48485 RepID=A0A8H4ZVF7_9HYPO|nr:hypothetical protein FANTH_1553 [Fusarium anthophilum]
MELLQHLQLEVELQLQCDGGAGLQELHITDLSRQVRETNYREKLSRLLAEIATCASLDPVEPASITLLHGSLLWQLPAFCNHGFLVDQRAIKIRNWALLTLKTSLIQNTDEIWNHVEVTNWISTSQSTVLFTIGNSQSLKRLETFSIEVINRMENYGPVIYLLNPLPNGFSESSAFSTIGVLRQLAIQCLQTLTTPKTLEFLAKMNRDFRSTMERDWYSLLAELIEFQQQMTIILEVGVLRNKFREADTWAAEFLTLIEWLQGKTCLKVMIITGRPINADDNSIVRRMTVGSVPTKSLSHTANQRLVRPAVRQRSPQNAVTGYRGPSLTSSILEGQEPPNAPNAVTEVAFSTKVVSSNRQHRKGPKTEELPHADNLPMHCIADSLQKNLGATQASESNSSKRATEQWFKVLESTTHQFMYKEVFQSQVAVKIAVLDTGFAYMNPEDKRALRPYYQRIKRFTNFIDGGSDAEAKSDPTGHGTAVAVQILRVSLRAVLYICRVVSPDSGPDKSAIEKAIRKAAAKPDKYIPDGGGWGVDIINMSFGWPYDHEGVRKAIDFARQKGVHMFAATSNDGLLGPPNDILYPARSVSVIAVDAADGHGDHAKSAPSSASAHSQGSRFSAPGLGISSPNSEEILEGSSFACPIVAGVTALILEFARQPPLSKSPSVQTYLQEWPAMLNC